MNKIGFEDDKKKNIFTEVTLTGIIYLVVVQTFKAFIGFITFRWLKWLWDWWRGTNDREK